jgi:hypothetical protein
MRKIIGFSGLIGSGKNTAAKYLIDHHGYTGLSFAGAVKDCLSVIFHWDRYLLEGESPESRIWRETVDSYWAKKLEIPNFTPRYAMTNIATDLFRNKFNDNIWIYSLEKKISSINSNIIISDCRFSNEIAMIRSLEGRVYRVARGEDPVWLSVARLYPQKMSILYPDVHTSEYSWASVELDGVIDNNSTVEHFISKIEKLA